MTIRTGDQQQTAEQLELEWRVDPRWEGVRRDYTAQQVIDLRGPVREERTLATRGAQRLWEQVTENTGTAHEPAAEPT